MSKVISILEWRMSKNMMPFFFPTEQDRRDWERENKLRHDEELIRAILMRGSFTPGKPQE